MSKVIHVGFGEESRSIAACAVCFETVYKAEVEQLEDRQWKIVRLICVNCDNEIDIETLVILRG